MTKEKEEKESNPIIKSEINLKLIGDGFAGLMRNDYDLICPMVQPFPVRQLVKSNIIGGQMQEQMTIQKTICNTGCPLFQVNDNDTVTICCGGTPVTHRISKVIPILEQPKNTNKNDTKVIPFSGGKRGEA